MVISKDEVIKGLIVAWLIMIYNLVSIRRL